MKLNLIALIVAVVLSGVLGGFIEKQYSSLQQLQKASMAGQTLADLARALEREKDAKGVYPDSIVKLKVTSEEGDFSEELLHKVIYLKVNSAYVAFVGLSNVSYIQPGDTPVYK